MLQDIPLDTKTISNDKLNITDKTRSNLFTWNGQFSPLLAQVLLKTYAKQGDFVVDPFLGSGTVLVEAGRQNLKAFGSEINPAAFLMAQTYRLINRSPEHRALMMNSVEARLKDIFTSHNLFSSVARDTELCDPKMQLLNVWRTEADADRKMLLETVIIMSDFYKTGFDANSIFSASQRLAATLEQLPYSQKMLALSLSDARNLPLAHCSADLVVTSPPYINVFNYHQQYRASAEALGWDLLHVAKSEIGSNRKHRANRFLTVIQYCLDIAQTLVELRRISKPNARLVLVVGRESNVLKTPFYNGDIVSRLGTQCAGLQAEKRQERTFINRFGSSITEDILHFRVSSDSSAPTVSPAVIAEQALCYAYDQAPEVSRPALQEAISKVRTVKASPLFQSTERKTLHYEDANSSS